MDHFQAAGLLLRQYLIEKPDADDRANVELRIKSLGGARRAAANDSSRRASVKPVDAARRTARAAAARRSRRLKYTWVMLGVTGAVGIAAIGVGAYTGRAPRGSQERLRQDGGRLLAGADQRAQVDGDRHRRAHRRGSGGGGGDGGACHRRAAQAGARTRTRTARARGASLRQRAGVLMRPAIGLVRSWRCRSGGCSLLFNGNDLHGRQRRRRRHGRRDDMGGGGDPTWRGGGSDGGGGGGGGGRVHAGHDGRSRRSTPVAATMIPYDIAARRHQQRRPARHRRRQLNSNSLQCAARRRRAARSPSRRRRRSPLRDAAVS